jgi:hypothetical protein
MNSYVKFVELYQSVNVPIELTEDTKTGVKTITLEVPSWNELDKDSKITGYSGFTTVLRFDKDGVFLRQEIWE